MLLGWIRKSSWLITDPVIRTQGFHSLLLKQPMTNAEQHSANRRWSQVCWLQIYVLTGPGGFCSGKTGVLMQVVSTSRHRSCQRPLTCNAHSRMAGSVTLGRKLSGSAEKSSGTALSKSLPAAPKLAARNSCRVWLAGKPFASFGSELKLAFTAAASLSRGMSLNIADSTCLQLVSGSV